MDVLKFDEELKVLRSEMRDKAAAEKELKIVQEKAQAKLDED